MSERHVSRVGPIWQRLRSRGDGRGGALATAASRWPAEDRPGMREQRVVGIVISSQVGG